MDEIIAERKQEFEQDPEAASKRGDLLANLIAAAAEDGEGGDQTVDGGKKKGLSLSQSDLRGCVLTCYIDRCYNTDDPGFSVHRNVFIYLIAGHEVFPYRVIKFVRLTRNENQTTAHTLTYMFGLLALHPEEQEKLYKQTREVLGDRQAVSLEPNKDCFAHETIVDIRGSSPADSCSCVSETFF